MRFETKVMAASWCRRCWRKRQRSALR